jgi:hypothetical protein
MMLPMNIYTQPKKSNMVFNEILDLFLASCLSKGNQVTCYSLFKQYLKKGKVLHIHTFHHGNDVICFEINFTRNFQHLVD